MFAWGGLDAWVGIKPQGLFVFHLFPHTLPLSNSSQELNHSLAIVIEFQDRARSQDCSKVGSLGTFLCLPGAGLNPGVFLFLFISTHSSSEP